jgi:hypothetical protein
MCSEGLAERLAHFKQNYLLWVVVRHFLSADLIEELSVAVVDAASNGSAALEDLFDTRISGGVSALATWVIRPRPVSQPFIGFLQRLIRAIVWQSDETVVPHDHDVKPVEKATMRSLESALELSHADLTTMAHWFTQAEALPEPLRVLVTAVNRLIEVVQPATTAALEPIITDIASRIEAPLSAILVKHLGDLCGGADLWDVAESLYSRAELMLAHPVDPIWREFIRALQPIILQSRASALRITAGPRDSSTLLVDALDSVLLKNNIIGLANATLDILSATAESDETRFPKDSRAAVLFAPQLLDAHDNSVALTSWANEEYPDAHRRFWAVLRRQIALGSATYSRYTKAYYGRSLIESLQAKDNKDRVAGDFWLGVRLLIESGVPKIANQTNWTESLVGRHVGIELVTKTIGHTRRAQGSLPERTLVTLTLFKRWLQVLPPGNALVAGAMLRFVAESARDFDWPFFSSRNLSGASFDALKEVGLARPEFRASVADGVIAAIIAKLADKELFAVVKAFETADAYVDAFDDRGLTLIVTTTLEVLERFDAHGRPWPVIQPALALLSCAAVKSLCDKDLALKAAVTSKLLSVSIETASENTSLMFVLRDLDPALIAAELDLNRLESVVSEIRRRAGEINSSAAVNNIEALLVAPTISRDAGIRDAIGGLLAILQSAARGRPSISFGQAYRPLMMLTEEREKIARDLSIPETEVTIMVEPLLDMLLQVWRKAAEMPLIFSGFAIPVPTAPNSTLVHNFTFASIGLARALGRENLMNDAMDGASRQPTLEMPMAVARAIRITAGDLEIFDLQSIQDEKRDAFYAALGQRLVLLKDLPPNTRTEIIKVLLEQCLRLGPKGVDAGVFTIALELSVFIENGSVELKNYRLRLDNDRELRLSVTPLLARISPR